MNRAVSAMVAAVEVYNKPDFPYRAESFTILALNSWELLIKAKWLTEHRNKLSSLYVREGRGKKRQRIKRTRSGNPRTHDLLYLARKLREEKKLEEAIYRNLEVLEEFRNSSIHFYHADPNFAEKLQQVAMAAVKNFHTAMREWFDEDLSRFNFYQMPLSFVSPPPVTEGIVLRRAESRFLNFIRQQQTEGEKEGSLYLVSVNVEVRFVRSKKTEAEAVRVTTDPNAPAVRLTEEQIRDTYRWDYRTLTEKCRDRYEDFKVDKRYHELRKQIETDLRYVHVRRLDPLNPKSPRKCFYNPDILRIFDAYYTRRNKRG